MPKRIIAGAAESAESQAPPNSHLKRLADAAETIVTSGIAAARGTGGIELDLRKVATNSLARLFGGTVPTDPGQLLQRLEAVFPEVGTGVTGPVYSYRAFGLQPTFGPNGTLMAGAQGALYQQARSLATSIGILLDSLVPAITDPDEDQISDLKEELRSAVEKLVAEYGREGGVAYGIFNDCETTSTDMLKNLRTALGLDGNGGRELDLSINEKNRLDGDVALIEGLVKELVKLKTTYERYLKANSNLVKLTWTVRAIPATVSEIVEAFDAIRFGSSDRAAEVISEHGKEITIQQALDWFAESATSVWPARLSSNVHQRDLQVIHREVTSQKTVVDEIVKWVKKTPRGSLVTFALHELEERLDDILTTIADIDNEN